MLICSGWEAATATMQEGADVVGTSAPAWTVTQWINSAPLSLAKLRGQVVLLRWWTAPGCSFCEASAPYLAQWHQRYAAHGLVVIGMYHPKPPGRIPVEVVKKLARGLGMTFPLALDPDWETLRRYWLDGRTDAWTSVSFLIDQEGVIRHVHPGGSYTEEDARAMDTTIRELLQLPPFAEAPRAQGKAAP